MDKDFWDKTFGGKDTLRLSIGAHSFRIRQNRYSSTATFEYGEGMRVRIVCEMRPFHEISQTYMIHGERGTFGCSYISTISYIVQELTGLVLNCFE
jgi:hypothetical protein